MNNDVFETMPVPKAYFKMALPVVFGMVISLVYNMVDTWFIAKTQNTSLVAGVSLCAPVFSLMIAFGDIFGLGGSSAISRLFGKKDYDTARRISAFCLLGSIFFGIAVAVLMLLFQTPILHLLGARDDTIAYAGAYYRFLVLGCPAIIFNIVPGNLLRTEGLANDAMIGSVIGAVFNIFFRSHFHLLSAYGCRRRRTCHHPEQSACRLLSRVGCIQKGRASVDVLPRNAYFIRSCP